MKKMVCLLFIAALFIGAIPVTAGATWMQEWNETPPYNLVPGASGFDSIKMFIETPGVYFADLINFRPAGWVVTEVNPQYSSASGPETNYLDFFTNFTIDQNVPLIADFYAFSGGTLIDKTSRSWWNGLSQYPILSTLTKSFGDENRTAAVPEPETIMLLAVGIAFLFFAGGVRHYQWNQC